MYSKLKPLSLISEKDFPDLSNKLVIVYSSIDLFTTLLKQRLQKNHSTLKTLWGMNFNNKSFFEKIFTFDLFSQDESYFIYSANKITSFDLDLFIEQAKSNNSYVFLHFSDRKTLKNIKKKSELTILDLQGFDFWEDVPFLSFLENVLNEKFSEDLKEYIRSFPKDRLESIYAYLKRAKIYFSDLKNVSKDDIDNFSSLIEVNVFDFLPILKNNNLSLFKRRVEEIYKGGGSADLFGLINYLKNVLYKISDHSSFEGNKKLSKYDKTLQAISVALSANHQINWVKYLSCLEISLKKNKKNEFLNELRSSVLN